MCNKFETCRDFDAPIVLVEWINQLHSSPSVNVTHCMPRFLGKFLSAIEMQEGEQNNDLGKKAIELLGRFLTDLKENSSRNMQLDREVIIKLQEFLVKCDESKRVVIMISLEWLYFFIDFFRTDYLMVLQMHQSANNGAGAQEESKDNMIGG